MSSSPIRIFFGISGRPARSKNLAKNTRRQDNQTDSNRNNNEISSINETPSTQPTLATLLRLTKIESDPVHSTLFVTAPIHRNNNTTTQPHDNPSFELDAREEYAYAAELVLFPFTRRWADDWHPRTERCIRSTKVGWRTWVWLWRVQQQQWTGSSWRHQRRRGFQLCPSLLEATLSFPSHGFPGTVSRAWTL